MKVPRSKVKTDYSRLLCCLVFVIESDLSVLLTHSIFALGFVLVAGRWRATGHSRAHGPTPCIYETWQRLWITQKKVRSY